MYNPDATRATVDDVAQAAGVSIKTVSRVVNREPNVRAATRERVEAAITSLNYRPNASARNLASARSHIIALIYDDPSAYEAPSSGYVLSLQEGALRACRAANRELLIHPCDYRSRKVSEELQTLFAQTRPDGIVLAAPLSNMPKIVNAVKASGIPCVSLSPGRAKVPANAVVTNDQDICAEMTAYLASLGHQRIAFVQGDAKHKAVSNRFLGYLDGLSASGLARNDHYVVQGDSSIASGERGAEQLLSLPQPPTAIFAANDDMAAGVTRAALRRGVRIPDDLSVAGFDDSPLAQLVFPALTSIRQPSAAMAQRATQLLINPDDIDNGGSNVVPASIVLRESTGPIA
ncbi:LacI family transcriptional regulator [bacterium]|nr:LacI family transcriptional regulator [bacterium]